MPRPSLKGKRREQILDAYEICVARYGVEGATLEKIAEFAGIARPLIRHNVGNRDDLLALLIDRFLTKSYSSMERLVSSLNAQTPADELIEVLFDPRFSDSRFILVAEALIAASADDSVLAKRMRKWSRDFIKTVKNVLVQQYPEAESAAIDAVAAGLTGIYFNVDSLSPLGSMPDIQNASRAAAVRLTATLET